MNTNKNKLTYYVDRFIGKWDSASDILALGTFPNAKEITESMGAYDAIRKVCKIDKQNQSTLVICIGDGVVPRTGCLLAFKTKWHVISIDPMLNKSAKHRQSSIEVFKNVRRLQIIPKKIQDVDPKELKDSLDFIDNIIILSVHGHASLRITYDKIIKALSILEYSPQNIFIVSMPCCKKDDIDFPFISYEDKYILSPENRINIYNMLNSNQVMNTFSNKDTK